MSRLRVLLFAIVILLTVGATLLSLNGCGGAGSSTTPPPPGKIQHVVIIFQENRTPDNLFQDPVLINAGAAMRKAEKTRPATPSNSRKSHWSSTTIPATVTPPFSICAI